MPELASCAFFGLRLHGGRPPDLSFGIPPKWLRFATSLLLPTYCVADAGPSPHANSSPFCGGSMVFHPHAIANGQAQVGFTTPLLFCVLLSYMICCSKLSFHSCICCMLHAVQACGPVMKAAPAGSTCNNYHEHLQRFTHY